MEVMTDAPDIAPLHDDVRTAAPARRSHVLCDIRARWLLVAIVLVSTTATLLAMRRTSPTFDEIVLIAGGARGWQTGVFDLAPDHPPLMQYLYGLPVHLSKPSLPDESHVSDAARQAGMYRYNYSQQFFFNEGNDPERVAYLGRLPAALCGLLLVVTAFAATRKRWGERAAVIAALLVAFLPDVLAHGGVAYNDLPLALVFLAAVFAIDRAIRTASIVHGAAAGVLIGLGLGVKISAAALAPTAVILLLTEGAIRWRDPRWRRRIAPAALATIAAAYVVLAIIFLGDWDLSAFRWGLDFRYRHMTGGHGASAYLLGETSRTGWWYFFPVAFLFKTSAALHLLLALGTLWLLKELREKPRRLLTSPLRAPLVGGAVFGAALLSSNLNIGFRYAMPLLPLLCVIAAVGIAKLWDHAPRAGRLAMSAALAWVVLSPLSYYPHFLSYISEYGPGRDRGHEVLVDSSLDWGQGLLELRDFMRDEGIDRVWLSYFGSNLPAGYGIEYDPLPGFFPLAPRPRPAGAQDPEYAVISATNLAGPYLSADPFARFRDAEPYRVLGHTMFVYRLGR